jgi:tRNA threonylcarbamoyladenosine biosynthesis protein TsaE
MKRLVYQADGETATRYLGRALASVLPPGSTVALMGTLGAGKTRLVQAVAEAAGVAPGDVVSPTFVLMQEYRGHRVIYHFDAYRIPSEDEFLELGPDEYFEAGQWVFIEWADRVARLLPRERLEIHVEVTGVQSRRMEFLAVGAHYETVLDQLQTRLAGPSTGAPW